MGKQAAEKAISSRDVVCETLCHFETETSIELFGSFFRPLKRALAVSPHCSNNLIGTASPIALYPAGEGWR
jgi:hypothetical protein